MFTHTLTIVVTKRSAWRGIALLALLAFPLACDQTPTAPTSRSRPAVETSLLSNSLVIYNTQFDNSQYFPISVSQAAQYQYGLGARDSLICKHLYCWRAWVNGQLYSIDMQRAVRDQYGSGYILGAVGVGAYDWVAVHWSALTAPAGSWPQGRQVLPVMVIASDYFWNLSAVGTALQNLESTLAATQSWYKSALAAVPGCYRCAISFHMLQPLVVFNQSSFSYTAAQWNAFSAQGSSAPFNDGSTTLSVLAWNAYASVYPGNSLGGSDSMEVRLLISVFTGDSPTVDGGTGWQPMSVGSSYVRAAASVVPPIVSSHWCSWGTGGSGLNNNPPCEEATYLVAHELGYTFGLQSCNYDLACLRNTIMGYAEPPYATLESSQAGTLLGSNFFYP